MNGRTSKSDLMEGFARPGVIARLAADNGLSGKPSGANPYLSVHKENHLLMEEAVVFFVDI